MVSTHQQYLCPDFLNPSPPNTVDSSPLALLAQTCNSIGLPDTPVTASTNGTSSRSVKNETSKSSESTRNHNKEEISKNNNAKRATTSAADSSSDSSTSNSTVRSSPMSKDQNGIHSPESNRKSENRSRTSQNANVSSSEINGRLSEHSSVDIKPTIPTAVSSIASTSTTSSLLLNKCMGTTSGLTQFPPSVFPPGLIPPYLPSNPTMPAFPYGPTAHMPPLAFAAGSCYQPFPTAIPMITGGPWMQPPFPGFTPKCTDPFCKTCPAIAATMRGPCVVGCHCIQCVSGHSAGDLPLWLSSYGSLLGQTTGLHNVSTSMAAGSASLYAAAAAMAAAQANSLTSSNTSTSTANQSQQHTCSWMTGNEFCGKRFSSSEELLQHLRSHTSQDSAAAAAHSAAALSTPAVSAAVASGHLSAAAGRLSPRSNYLNSLNSLRYHPYAKLTPTPTSANAAVAAAALASLPFPQTSLAPALNPLSALCSTLSAQRLPASLPHP